jgi:hypothetical protein
VACSAVARPAPRSSASDRTARRVAGCLCDYLQVLRCASCKTCNTCHSCPLRLLRMGIGDALPRLVGQFRTSPGKTRCVSSGWLLGWVRSKKQSTTGPYRGTSTSRQEQSSHSASLLSGHPRFGELGRTGVWRGVCVVGWTGAPKLLSACAPRHPGRVLASSCDTGNVFSCAFPHVPVHRPRPCAAEVTLPDSSKVHPPSVLCTLCPTPGYFPACNREEIGETAGARTGAKGVSKRPAHGIRSASPQCPLSAASKPALHPAPAFSLRTTTDSTPASGIITTTAKTAPFILLSFAVCDSQGLLNRCKLPPLLSPPCPCPPSQPSSQLQTSVIPRRKGWWGRPLSSWSKTRISATRTQN